MTSPAAKVAEIEDLIQQILIKIPAKPLLKLKCVCKLWQALISDRGFCASHARLHHSTTPTALFLYNYSDHLMELPVIPLESLRYPNKHFVLKDYFELPQARILQSCNGLLLCRPLFHIPLLCPRQAFNVSSGGCVYFVCNPTTQQLKRLSVYSLILEKLKIHGNQFEWYKLFSAYLVFDPSTSPYYKIFLFFDLIEFKDCKTCKVEVFTYSSETESWSRHQLEVSMEILFDRLPLDYPLVQFRFDDGFYYNGAIHWAKYHRYASLHRFDVETMTLKKLPFPISTMYIGSFGESQGHLYGRRRVVHYPELEFEVIKIEADFSRWSVVYRVNLQSVSGFHGCSSISVMRIIHDKSTDKLMLVMTSKDGLRAYDPSSRKCFKIWNSYSRLDCGVCTAYLYSDSLICV